MPKDIHVHLWSFSPTWVMKHGIEAVQFWSQQGFETSGHTWNNRQSVWYWAQLVAKARSKGYNCKGMFGFAWNKRSEGIKDAAIVSWRIPRKGEKRYVEIPEF